MPCEKPAARLRASLRASAITTFGHYFASLLIADGADVKTVQARLRHASAKTTLDTYGHIWPERDESTRAAVDTVLSAYLTEQRRNSATAGT
jgi:integrase